MSRILLRQFYRSFVKSTSSNKKKLNPIFREYIAELSKKSQLCSQSERKTMDTHIKEYLTMRKSIREQLQILKLNKVGVFRDQRQQVKNVARHVGLAINLPPQMQNLSSLTENNNKKKQGDKSQEDKQKNEAGQKLQNTTFNERAEFSSSDPEKK